MNILILGGGGREHALAWACAQHPAVDRVVAAPGNPGVAGVAECAAIDPCDGGAVVELAAAEAIDLCLIGPEAPLAAGVADRLREAGMAVLGPSAEAARIETSKAFAHEVCDAAGIATAAWTRFEDAAAAEAHIRTRGAPIVVKADGLAAGKGVTVAADLDTALTAAREALAQGPIVVEEVLTGEEASFFALCDGEEAIPFGTAQDHKRAWDGDRGPNTGGMGAYSPAPVLRGLEERVMTRVVRPLLAEMTRRGVPYRGVLYAGLMVDGDAIRVVEFNARLGDPEAQVLLMRLGAQAVDLMQACAEGRLAGERARWADDHALCVVMASGRLSRAPRARRADRRAGGPAGGLAAHGLPRRHGGGGRAGRQRRRPGARRHGARRQPGRVARRRLCDGGRDRLPGRPLAPRHRRARVREGRPDRLTRRLPASRPARAGRAPPVARRVRRRADRCAEARSRGREG